MFPAFNISRPIVLLPTVIHIMQREDLSWTYITLPVI
jgi:hypothetical protein